ncbi:MAG: hypothetical protein ABI528_07680, partial [bacterium]
YNRPTQEYNRPTQEYNRPTQEYNRPTQEYNSRKQRNKKCPGFLEETIKTADNYLHYSNGILFYIEGVLTAVNLIFITSARLVQSIPVMLILLSDEENCFIYFCFTSHAKSFEGVIERYCGVPP